MMTDKQLEEKKREFYDKFCVDKVHTDATLSADDLWSWIEKLVEEGEREQRKLIEQFFDNDKRKNMPDVPIELLVEAEKIDSYDEGWKDGCEAGQRSLN